jgi:hypothetical protein
MHRSSFEHIFSVSAALQRSASAGAKRGHALATRVGLGTFGCQCILCRFAEFADPSCALATAQVLKGQSTVKWAFAPLESLYDVEAIMRNWEELGTKASCCSSVSW